MFKNKCTTVLESEYQTTKNFNVKQTEHPLNECRVQNAHLYLFNKFYRHRIKTAVLVTSIAQCNSAQCQANRKCFSCKDYNIILCIIPFIYINSAFFPMKTPDLRHVKVSICRYPACLDKQVHISLKQVYITFFKNLFE